MILGSLPHPIPFSAKSPSTFFLSHLPKLVITFFATPNPFLLNAINQAHLLKIQETEKKVQSLSPGITYAICVLSILYLHIHMVGK